MIVRSFILRLSQIVAASATIYLLVMVATLVLQEQFEEAIPLGFLALGAAAWWIVSFFVIARLEDELVREVARILYPLGALVSFGLSIVLGLQLFNMVAVPVAQQWSVILAGVLIVAVLFVRMFDIRWLRSAEELRPMRTPKGDSSNR